MISFNTFTGPACAAGDHGIEAAEGSIVHHGETVCIATGDAVFQRRSSSSSSSCSSAFDEADADAAAAASFDLFHERTYAARSNRSGKKLMKGRRKGKARRQVRSQHGGQSTHEDEGDEKPMQCGTSSDSGSERREKEQELDESQISRPQQWLRLLVLQHQTGLARMALVNKLLSMAHVNELLLSKATEDMIAHAANDAITDEILASVDQEQQRRKSLCSMPNPDNEALDEPVPMQPSLHSYEYNTYRVLELLDVLDTTTGGMVKRILTNVQRRTPFASFGVSANEDGLVEFCRFCSAFGDHSSTQHRCRVCGQIGHHRSRSCPQRKLSIDAEERSDGMRSASSVVSSTGTPDTTKEKHADALFCSLCNAWGLHSSENHRCRQCGAAGEHRSRNCPNQQQRNFVARLKGSPPVDGTNEAKKFCELCQSWSLHTTEEHRCRLCHAAGDHRSKNCRLSTPPSNMEEIEIGSEASDSRLYCLFCGKRGAHRSQEHICRICRAKGNHRSSDCPERKDGQSMLSYSVEKASKVRDRVLEKLPSVIPASTATMVFNSMDKVADVDTIMRRTLQRIGVWGGGSQTPITTPYAAPANASAAQPSTTAQAMQTVNHAGAYVLSYAEGHSVVPERILKYMRLLMHHEVSTNAFSVVVRFDPRSSQWELQRPGMVTPRSLPTSPTMNEQLKKRMAKYTLQVLFGAREKLIKEIEAQRQFQQQRHFNLNDVE